MKLSQSIIQNFIIYSIHNKKQLFFYYNYKNNKNKIKLNNNMLYKQYLNNNTYIKTF